MATFNYLTKNIINGLTAFEYAGRNVFLGAVTCSVIEFLGRCIRNPQDNKNGFLNFQKFVEEYLSKEDPRYKKYMSVLYKDLRHGSAHSILPKGGVSLSYDPNSINLHLRLVKNKKYDYYYLWIYTPKFLNDLRSSIFKFVETAQANKALENNYIQTLECLKREGQDILQKNLSQSDFSNAIEIESYGDIIA